MRARSIAILFLAVAAAPGLARADVYSFTDASGITHFSNVPTDSRYQLLIAAPTEAVASEEEEVDADELAQDIASRLGEVNQDLSLIADVFESLEPERKEELLKQLRYSAELVAFLEGR